MSTADTDQPHVGLFSAFVPRELVFASGCTPVRVFPTTTKPTAAEAYLPRNFCALTRNLLATFLEERPPVQAVVFTDEDDAVRRLQDIWAECVPVPIWGSLEVPRTGDATAVRRFAAELARLAEQLERYTGVPLSAHRLRVAIALYNHQRRLLAALKARWLDGTLPTPLYRRLRQTTLTEHPQRASEALQAQLDALSVLAEAPRLADSPDRSGVRLMLLAELAAPAALVRLLEANGARVVAEVSDLDELSMTAMIAETGETVDALLIALAEAYLGKSPAPRVRAPMRRLEYLTRLARERAANAVICAYSKFCDLPLAEYPMLRTAMERLGIPVLLLELEDEALSGQQRTRVEAFLETVRTHG
ncbi:MAG: 2-hydroxyacyl-CoA dehydratase family protein [Anaerolineae bacterium]|nr:2-hydroxyacyl-CoA dehydratase family protein [Anaerolineae bacterium]MDW8072540.1 2-hydroxyacyl-CoA dehydratase family protein [Anaerolineae bacterium]